jgi:hypothetical protein
MGERMIDEFLSMSIDLNSPCQNLKQVGDRVVKVCRQ